jgi:ornithine cyclodeaminase/alanine dehydrogenase-like protein (mu-crystallin family)
MTLILSNDDVAKLLTMQECIDVLEDVYVELSEGRGVNRVRSDCLVPSGQGEAVYSLKSMDGVIPKLGIGAVRIDSDIVTWPRQGNAMRRVKVPAAPNGRYVGLVLLFSSATGEPPANHWRSSPMGSCRGCGLVPPTGLASSISRARMRARLPFLAPAGRRVHN